MKQAASILAVLSVSLAVTAAENRWLGRSAVWEDAANWSAGVVPDGQRGEQVAVGFVEGGASPGLARDATVGGSLIIESGARLSLNGHALAVGGAAALERAGEAFGVPAADAVCLIVHGNAALDTAGGALILQAGGLVNRGAIAGSPALTVAGGASGFLIENETPLALAELILESSPFPYPVSVRGPVAVQGDLELRGGHFVASRGDAAGRGAARITVAGDLRFAGGDAPVMLTAETDLAVWGTIRSDGSAACFEVPGEVPVWDERENMGLCRSRDDAPWVRLVGPGDRVIEPGGLLPPILIDKPDANVTLAGDLHCMGLYIRPHSTLILSDGQSLAFGHPEREFAAFRPRGGGDPQPGFIRSSRDLINLGELRGAESFPLVFDLNLKGVGYRVTCRYRPAGTAAAPDGVGDSMLQAAAPWAAPNSLSINRYNSRLQLRADGILLLDDQPYDPDRPPKPTADDELDLLLGLGSQAAADRAATVDRIALRRFGQPFQPPPEKPVNIAPLAERILTPGRATTVFAGQGALWANRDVYGAVDGDPWIGTGGSEFYEFVLPGPVPVGAVRLFSRSSIRDAHRFVVLGDTAGRGAADTVVAAAGLGTPPEDQSWTVWGVGGSVFAPVEVSRLRVLFLDRTGNPVGAHLGEFEIYADEEAADHLAARAAADEPAPFPRDVPWLERGEAVAVQGVEPAPENRVRRVASIAFWMAGISWSRAADPESYNRLPHLRDHEGVQALLQGVADLHYDAVTIFFEAESIGFPWPTVNFRSALNARYLQQRELALTIREAVAPKLEGDELFDNLLAEPVETGSLERMQVAEPEGEFADVLRIEDLPCQRNLLREFREAAHERGIEVYVISRPEDMNLYTGPEDQDPYEVFLRECAAAGVDGVSIVPDEQHPLWAVTRTEPWKDFDERTREARTDFTPEQEKRWIVERAEIAGQGLNERMRSVRTVNPDVMFYVDGAHLTNRGDPYDLIWGKAPPDYVGCSYQSHLVRRWASVTDNRRVAMGSYPHRSVRYNLESVLQGARMVRTYRYNYIELAGSADQRRRENLFIKQWVRVGATRPARAPTALLLSRASEAWWPMDVRAGRVPDADSNPDRCWQIGEIVYEFLLKNGYPFDVFTLERTGDLDDLAHYPLVILPFAYAVPRDALAALETAVDAGSKLLVFEREGDVDDFGVPYGEPALRPLLARGAAAAAGKVAAPELDLLESESHRTFERDLRALLDSMLGEAKDLELDRFGNRIFATAATVAPRERYLSLLNWENRPANIVVGTTMPPGDYRVMTLSSADPESFREGRIGGGAIVTAASLRRFAVELANDEALTLHLMPAGRDR